jgi:hypothetical protein
MTICVEEARSVYPDYAGGFYRATAGNRERRLARERRCQVSAGIVLARHPQWQKALESKRTQEAC